jgi:TetR/AcrR family transcriptional regulator, cholesterol catabolism regulator
MPPEDYQQFLQRVEALKQQCCLKLFDENRQSIQIKKEKTIAKNMERIFGAALKVSNEKSFHAMSMRDLSREADMSIGALYNYFTGKEELLRMMQQQRRTITREILSTDIAAGKNPLEKLRTAIRTHLYLSEVMQPWFYFSYMEAKNLDPKERRAAVQSELNSERQFQEILEDGCAQGQFQAEDCQMTASLIKAMLQDWYLKRAKYGRRGIDVNQYTRYLTAFLEKNLCVNNDTSMQGGK